MKKIGKERLFEMMSRLDSSFKQPLNETERIAYTNLMKLFQENNMQSAKFIGLGYFMGKEIKKRVFPTEKNEAYAKELIQNPGKYNISQHEVNLLKKYVESEIWGKTKRGERPQKSDMSKSYAYFDREDQWSIIQLTRYTIKYMTPKDLAKSFEDMSDKEIELRRKYGFGKDYPEDDWRWKKGSRGGYTYGGAGEYPIAGKGGSSYIEKMGDFPLYGDVDMEGKPRIDPETGYQSMALRQNIAEHVAVVDTQYFLVDTDGKPYPITYKFANFFLKEILNQSKKDDSSVEELEKEEEEFANELKKITSLHKPKQFLDNNIAYLTATVIDDTTKEKKPIYFINDRVNIGTKNIKVDVNREELKPYIMQHLSDSYKLADEYARTYEAGLKENEESIITEQKARPLSEIAMEIKRDWGNRIYFGAKPYLDAMMTLNSIDDNYMFDSGHSIVAYFLSNASSWRGETARRIKKELNDMLKGRINEAQDDFIRTKKQLLDFIKYHKEKNKKAPDLGTLLPMLRDEAMYEMAIVVANKLLGYFSWNELPDTNSMWDYIDTKNGMKKDDFMESVKDAVNDRLSNSEMGIGGLDDLMENETSDIKTNKEKIIDELIQTSLDLANDQISQEEHDRKIKELENVLKNM